MLREQSALGQTSAATPKGYKAAFTWLIVALIFTFLIESFAILMSVVLIASVGRLRSLSSDFLLIGAIAVAYFLFCLYNIRLFRRGSFRKSIITSALLILPPLFFAFIQPNNYANGNACRGVTIPVSTREYSMDSDMPHVQFHRTLCIGFLSPTF